MSGLLQGGAGVEVSAAGLALVEAALVAAALAERLQARCQHRSKSLTTMADREFLLRRGFGEGASESWTVE